MMKDVGDVLNTTSRTVAPRSLPLDTPCTSDRFTVTSDSSQIAATGIHANTGESHDYANLLMGCPAGARFCLGSNTHVTSSSPRPGSRSTAVSDHGQDRR